MFGTVCSDYLEETCSHPYEREGRFLVQRALRADLKALEGMLDCFESQFKAGRPLTAAQKRAATQFLSCFLNFIRRQYLSEVISTTPSLPTRFQVPEESSGDHNPVQVLLARFEYEACTLLIAPNLKAQMCLLPGVKEVCAAFQQSCLVQFSEEEALMRKKSMHSAADNKVVTKMTKDMDGNSLAAFIRPMTKEQRRTIVKQQRIPFFSRWILYRLAAQYDKKVWQPFQRECLPTGMAAGAWI